MLSTLYLDRPPGADVERDFGVGYYRKREAADGVRSQQVAYAPFGNDPLLLDDVTITNTARHQRGSSWFEYWDVNPYDQRRRGGTRGSGAARLERAPATRCRAIGSPADTAPLSIFAAALRGRCEGTRPRVATFFGAATRATPAAVVGRPLAGGCAGPRRRGSSHAAVRVPGAGARSRPGRR